MGHVTHPNFSNLGPNITQLLKEIVLLDLDKKKK